MARLGDPVITTPRLHLRRFAVRDAAALQAIMRRPEVPEQLKIVRLGLPWETWARALLGGGARALRLTVTPVETDRLIGIVGLNREGRLHYLVDPEHWGRGVATEAVGAAITVMLCDPQLREIEAEVFDANPASARVLEKLGFAARRRTMARRPGALMAEPATLFALSAQGAGQ